MATSLQLNCDVRIHGSYSNAEDFGDPTVAIMHAIRHAFPQGTGDNAANRVWKDQRSLSGASETLDLVGSLTDAFGNVLSFSAIKMLYIHNRSTTHAHVLTVSGSALTNFTTSSTSHKIRGSGIFLLTAPIQGFAVSAGVADQLTLSPATDSFDYDIIVAGVGS